MALSEAANRSTKYELSSLSCGGGAGVSAACATTARMLLYISVCWSLSLEAIASISAFATETSASASFLISATSASIRALYVSSSLFSTEARASFCDLALAISLSMRYRTEANADSASLARRLASEMSASRSSYEGEMG